MLKSATKKRFTGTHLLFLPVQDVRVRLAGTNALSHGGLRAGIHLLRQQDKGEMLTPEARCPLVVLCHLAAMALASVWQELCCV